jgi:hypothetical protein
VTTATAFVAHLIDLPSSRNDLEQKGTWIGGESVSQPPLKDQAFSTFLAKPTV